MAALEIREEQVRALVTDRSNWSRAVIGAPLEPVARELRALRLDQAPVIDSRDRAIGVVWASALEERLKAGDEPRMEVGEWIRGSRWELGGGIDELLASLSEHRAVLVAEPGREPFGLLSISDLSWPEFRAVLFPLFCALEHHLARLIGSAFEDEWTWIEGLPDHSKPGIVGHWKIAERSRVETKATVGATLRDLLSVVLRFEYLRTELLPGRSGNEADKLIKSIADFRNAVAHPTKPLVLNQKDVEKLRKALAGAVDLEQNARSAVEKAGAK